MLTPDTFPMTSLLDSNLAFLRLSGFNYQPDNQNIWLTTHRIRMAFCINYGLEWKDHVRKFPLILDMEFPEDDPAVDAMKYVITIYLNSAANPLNKI